MLGTEPDVKETYVKAGQVKLVFNPMLDHDDRSFQAHQAAECAAEQGHFWALHDVMFERQPELYGGNIMETLKGMAAEVGLDSAQFNTCLDEQRYAELVLSQDERRHQLGIRTRPTFDINQQFVVGAQPFAALQSVIEPMLSQ